MTFSSAKAVQKTEDPSAERGQHLVAPYVDDGGSAAHAQRAERPITWSGFREALNRWAMENGAPREVLFDNPHWSLLSRAVFGPPYVYLCWGTPKRGTRWRWARTLRLKAILAAATVLLVHDPITGRWIRRFVGRQAVLVRHPVDTTFFHPAPAGWPRRGHILVPGNNDRREKVVLELARLGIEVVRVCRDPRTVKVYDQFGVPKNVKLAYRVSWDRLRELYWDAVAVVLPTGGTTHAAGQTAMLEAIACGTQVFTDSYHLLGIAQAWNLPVWPLPRPISDFGRMLSTSSSTILKGEELNELSIVRQRRVYLDIISKGGVIAGRADALRDAHDG